MTRREVEVLYLKVCLNYSVKQIQNTLEMPYKTIVQVVRKYKRRFQRIPKGRLKKLFKTAMAGLILAYRQCPDCPNRHIEVIYENGWPEGVHCKKCGEDISLIPSARRYDT